MEGVERTLRHWWKEKCLEGEISIICRGSRNSEKDEWKPFRVATEEHWLKLKRTVKYRVRPG